MTEFWVAFSLLASAMHGCHRNPSRVRPPEISPSAAGTAAIVAYDRDGNDLLSAEELENLPGVSPERYDNNGDGQLSSDEIARRIRKWQTDQLGLTSFNCKVTLDGVPLERARVELIPEKFLGDAVKRAAGTTNQDGVAGITISADELPANQRDLTGVQCGIYKVMVNHRTKHIPPRYNRQTTLGQEVAIDTIVFPYIEYELRSQE